MILSQLHSMNHSVCFYKAVLCTWLLTVTCDYCSNLSAKVIAAPLCGPHLKVNRDVVRHTKQDALPKQLPLLSHELTHDRTAHTIATSPTQPALMLLQIPMTNVQSCCPRMVPTS